MFLAAFKNDVQLLRVDGVWRYESLIQKENSVARERFYDWTLGNIHKYRHIIKIIQI